MKRGLDLLSAKNPVRLIDQRRCSTGITCYSMQPPRSLGHLIQNIESAGPGPNGMLSMVLEGAAHAKRTTAFVVAHDFCAHSKVCKKGSANRWGYASTERLQKNTGRSSPRFFTAIFPRTSIRHRAQYVRLLIRPDTRFVSRGSTCHEGAAIYALPPSQDGKPGLS